MYYVDIVQVFIIKLYQHNKWPIRAPLIFIMFLITQIALPTLNQNPFVWGPGGGGAGGGKGIKNLW